jgi:hypothetical protein
MNRSSSYNKLLFIVVIGLWFMMPATFGQKSYRDILSADKVSLPDSLNRNLAEKIKFYPVPVKTDLNLENISSVTVIEIFDVMGKKHISQACNKQEQLSIPVSQLPRGVYFIRFVTPGTTVMKRFIKE